MTVACISFLMFKGKVIFPSSSEAKIKMQPWFFFSVYYILMLMLVHLVCYSVLFMCKRITESS